MGEVNESTGLEFEMLKRLGAKWAVLTAMTGEMAHKRISVSPAAIEGLKTARIKIGSGCFSPCEVSCELSVAEGQIFSQCHLLDHEDVERWCDLIAEAMQGKLDYERIAGIAALTPVRNDCAFLRCRCSESS